MAADRAAIPLRLIAVALLATAAAAADGYTNHTVGGDAGWFFNSTTNKTSADYQAWAANTTFNLGDYLIFNTNTNQTVIQTYNETTYNSCNTDDALDSDTFQYDGGENEFGSSMTIAVPLTINRTQYYFSDSDDGEQCQQGMAFTINVSYGLGLPPSLNHPPPPAYVQPPTSSPDEELPPPGTAVNTPPSNDAVMATSARLCASSVLLALLSLVA